MPSAAAAALSAISAVPLRQRVSIVDSTVVLAVSAGMILERSPPTSHTPSADRRAATISASEFLPSTYHEALAEPGRNAAAIALASA